VPVFNPLRVCDVRRETDDTVSVAFDVPAELAADYAFEPGQHLTVRMPSPGDGSEVRRSYSICSGLDDGELRIAVKNVPGGLFGAYACEHLKAGDVLDVMTPIGRFTVALDSTAEHSYLGVAAGSGITPVISLIRSVLAREPKSRFTLIYGNRTTASIIFREEIEDLKDRYLDRLQVIHVFTREQQGSELFNGRIDGDKIRAMATVLIDVKSSPEPVPRMPPIESI